MIDSMNDDALSLSMFWAGALMVFTPIVAAGAVLAVWWRQRVRARADASRADASRAPGT
jgi:hypothetical protein